MKNIALRPLALSGMVFFTSSCFLSVNMRGGKVYAAVASALFVAFLFLFALSREKSGKSVRSAAALLAAAMILLGLGLGFLIGTRSARRLQEAPGAGDSVSFTGEIKQVLWSSSYSSAYLADITDSRGVEYRVCLTGDPGFLYGEKVAGEAQFEKFPSGDDYGSWLLSQGAVAVCRCESGNLIPDSDADGKKFSPVYFFSKVRENLSARLKDVLGDSEGGFAAALLLGDKSGLDTRCAADFSDLGISHILAVSGMHLTVVCGFFTSVAPLGYKGKRYLSTVVVTAYMLLTGLGASVMRAGIMLIVYNFLSGFRRDSDRLTDLSIAASVIIIADPSAVYDVGLQLSAMSVLCLLLIGEAKRRDRGGWLGEMRRFDRAVKKKESSRWREYIRVLVRGMGSSLFTTVTVVLFLMPLAWLYFGKFSLAAPLAGLLFSLPVTVLLWSLPVVLILSPAPLFAVPVGKLCSLLIRAVMNLAAVLGRIPGICVSLHYPGAAAAVAVIFVLTLFLLCCNRKMKRGAAAALCAVIVISGVYVGVLRGINKNTAVADAVSSTSSDCICLSVGEKMLLCDTGYGSASLLAEGARAGEERCAVETEAILFTRLKTRQAAAFDSYSDRRRVRTVYIPTDSDEAAEQALRAAAAAKSVEVRVYEPGETLDFYGADIVTYPKEYLNRSKKPIVHLDIIYGGEKLAVCSACAGEAGENYREIDADVLYLAAGGPAPKSDSAGLYAGFYGRVSDIRCAPELRKYWSDAEDLEAYKFEK